MLHGVIASSQVRNLASDWWNWDGTNDSETLVSASGTGLNYNGVCVLSATTGLITYYGDGGAVFARVFTRNGKAITLGSEFSVEASGYITAYTYSLSATKAVIFYRPNIAPFSAHCKILDISGTTITGGTRHDVNDGNLAWNRDTAVLTSTKFVICYQDVADGSDGVLRVGDVSGTTITWGAEFKPNSVNADYAGLSTISSTQGVWARQAGGGGLQNAMIFDVAGTVVTFNTIYDIDIGVILSPFMQTDIDGTKTRAVTTYSAGTAPVGDCSAVAMSISGTVITLGTGTSLTTSDAQWTGGVTYLGTDTDDYYMVAFRDFADLTLSKIKVFRVTTGTETIVTTGPEITIYDDPTLNVGANPDIQFMSDGYAIAIYSNGADVYMKVLTTQ